MISERANDEIEREAAQWFKRANRAAPALGGALKTRCLQTKEWLAETRATWAAEANQALQAAGLAIQIDHRSYAAQGLDRPAGVHLGPHAHAMEQRGLRPTGGTSAAPSPRPTRSCGPFPCSSRRRRPRPGINSAPSAAPRPKLPPSRPGLSLSRCMRRAAWKWNRKGGLTAAGKHESARKHEQPGK